MKRTKGTLYEIQNFEKALIYFLRLKCSLKFKGYTVIKRYKEDNRMAQLVVSGNFFESAGQVSLNSKLDIKEQTREVLDKIDQLLALINTDKSSLTRVQIWLNDLKDFDAMNEVYDEWLKDAPKPVRACVGSTLVRGCKLEIQVFGYLKN